MDYEAPYGSPGGPHDQTAHYINGNPSTGTMGSIPPAASIENPQREIVNLIADAGMTPADTDLNQLARAIQSGKLIYADDAGTVNALQVTPSPALTVLNKGLVIVCKAANGNTGPATLKVNALAPVPIVHPSDQGQLVAYDINANQMLALAFDGTNFQFVWSARQPGSPVFLAAPRDMYIDAAAGSDTYDGLSASHTSGIHGPFATLQQGANQIPLYNLNGYSITFHVAAGTYNGFYQGKCNGSGSIWWVGNPAAPQNCLISGVNKSAAQFAFTGCTTYIDGFKLTAAGASSGDAIFLITAIGSGTVVIMGNLEFGSSVGGHIVGQFGAQYSNSPVGCQWKISGGSPGNAQAPGAFLFLYQTASWVSNAGGGPAITITATCNFAGGFVYVTGNCFSQLVYQSLTNPGGVIGQRFNVSYNSSISTASGGNINYYPGTIAGSTTTGSYYT